MYTTTTVAIGRRPMSGPGVGYGANRQQELTIVVPWSPEFGAAYQQFVNGGLNNAAGGMGGLGGGMSMGGLGGLPMGGFGGASQLGGFGGGSPLGGLGGGNQIQGVPIGFGVTTGI